MSEDVFPGLWGIPGGTVEYSIDDNLAEALEREIMEEVGITVSNIVMINNNIIKKHDCGTLYIIFSANYSSGIPTPLDGTTLVQWANLNTICSKEFTPKIKEMLIQYFQLL